MAFAGRSNCGKSSTINCLTGLKELARVSKIPGRTQLINFFQLNEGGRLVDLPGYGYAKASRQRQSLWNKAVNEYLEYRDNLCGLVLIMDARHPMEKFDVQMLNWVENRKNLELIVLFNKVDKLNQRQKAKCKTIANQLLNNIPRSSTFFFSAVRAIGRDPVRNRICTILKSERSY